MPIGERALAWVAKSLVEVGHADLKSTQIYTHVAVKQLKAIHAATHPAKSRQQAARDGSESTAEDVLVALAAEDEETSSSLPSDPLQPPLLR